MGWNPPTEKARVTATGRAGVGRRAGLGIRGVFLKVSAIATVFSSLVLFAVFPSVGAYPFDTCY